MNLDQINKIYLIGIGGIGMSALARYFLRKGKEVSGYDKTPTPLTYQLHQEGIVIHFEENISLIPKDADLVIYTPAVTSSHQELLYYKKSGTLLKKRAEVLGEITKAHFTIAIGGTHGKTTTSSIIAHILKFSGIDCTAFIGGISTNYNTNLIFSDTPEIMVVEADEYDRSFLSLHPDITVITSLDADHLDIYGEQQELNESFRHFANNTNTGGSLIIKQGLNISVNNKKVFTYSTDLPADFCTENICVKSGSFLFDVKSSTQHLKAVHFPLPGRHNIENALAAISVCTQLGIKSDQITQALASYRGVKRRFEYVLKSESLIFIDDYAHHPTEISACINAVKELYPGKNITGIFQPHLFTRTRDFAEEFAKNLEKLDEIILLEIYPAREQPLEGINSAMLLSKINHDHKQICSKEDLINLLKDKKKLEIVLTMGAGDIDQLVEPIKNLLQEK